MKNFEVKKEVWIWLIMILPIIYLFTTWNHLPAIVPTHFGLDGKPNGWSSRNSLIALVPGMTLGIYLLFTVIPAIDPKNRISTMGNKYFSFKLVMMIFMSATSFLVVQSAVSGGIAHVNLIFCMIGGLFVFLGNYMQTIKPNYFIGLRTPWTLESETVWRKTHALGGKVYFVLGLVIIVLPFIVKRHFQNVFLGLIAIAVIVPFAYSYILFRQEKGKPQA